MLWLTSMTRSAVFKLTSHNRSKRVQVLLTAEPESPSSPEKEPAGPEAPEELIGSLYRGFNRPIYNFFANSGFTRDESRDLTQETFLQAFRSLSTFRGRSSAPTWLFGIAKNIWLEAVRSRGRLKRNAETISFEHVPTNGETHQVQSPLEHLAESEEQLSGLLENERARVLRQALFSLPERMRLCVLLYFYQGRPTSEISALLGISEKTVRSQLSQARVKLRRTLSDQFPEFF
jgi:RNA polymerase sigma factor (sigma-70 family)